MFIMTDEAESEARVDKVSCETIVNALTSKTEEIAYLQELKTMFDAPEVHTILDELIQSCSHQKDLIESLRTKTCPV